MGAKLHGYRKPLNDNRPAFKGALNEVPISDDAFRYAPTIEPEIGKFWFCLVTVPQGEYRCSDKLAAFHNEYGEPMPVDTYVPTDTRWTLRMKGRDRLRVQVQSPVFRGYVFAKLSRPKMVDRGGGPELSCEEDWLPILERDRERKSPHGIIGVISYHGQPLTMPLRVPVIRNGIADFADDERDGYFDDRRRPALMAARNAKPAPVIMKGDEVTRMRDRSLARCSSPRMTTTSAAT